MIRFLLVSLLLTCALPAHADVVADWVDMAARGADGRLVPPPLQDQPTRSAAPLVALAMFEAANRADPRYVSYLGLTPATAAASPEAAVAVAAHDVLLKLRPEQKAMLDEALLVSLAGLPDDAALAAGHALGSDTAAATLARTLFEGPDAEPYRPRGVPGEFAPPMPTVLSTWSLRTQPLVLRSMDEAMPPPPPALTSAAYAESYNETKRLGGVGQPGATPEAKITARFLGGFNLDAMVRQVAAARPRLVDRARLWALVRVAQHDANGLIAVAKMKYMTWRPYNAIRNGDRDDNPATERDPNWEPVMSTPNHPEYPCGHCTMSGLMAGLLAPESKGPVSVPSDSAGYPVTMTFADWPAFLHAASLARIQGGMHFRFANDAGQAMGARIAALARERFAPPLKGR